jgi:hypothetical protein
MFSLRHRLASAKRGCVVDLEFANGRVSGP